MKSEREAEGNFLDLFLAAYSKFFRKAWLSLVNEQVSRLAKSASCQYFTVFRRIFAEGVKTLISSLRRKGIIDRELRCGRWRVSGFKKKFVGVKSLRREQNSCRFLTSSDDLVKDCFEGLKLPFTVPNNRSPSIIRISKHQTQNPSKSLRKPLLGQKDDDVPQVRQFNDDLILIYRHTLRYMAIGEANVESSTLTIFYTCVGTLCSNTLLYW